MILTFCSQHYLEINLVLASYYSTQIIAFLSALQVLVELFKRKEKILKTSQLKEEEIVTIYQILLKRINLYKEDLITIENLATAYELCRDIDETDTPHVALTIELGGLLWTGDKKLKQGLQSKGFVQLFELNNE